MPYRRCKPSPAAARPRPIVVFVTTLIDADHRPSLHEISPEKCITRHSMRIGVAAQVGTSASAIERETAATDRSSQR